LAWCLVFPPGPPQIVLGMTVTILAEYDLGRMARREIDPRGREFRMRRGAS